MRAAESQPACSQAARPKAAAGLGGRTTRGELMRTWLVDMRVGCARLDCARELDERQAVAADVMQVDAHRPKSHLLRLACSTHARACDAVCGHEQFSDGHVNGADCSALDA